MNTLKNFLIVAGIVLGIIAVGAAFVLLAVITHGIALLVVIIALGLFGLGVGAYEVADSMGWLK